MNIVNILRAMCLLFLSAISVAGAQAQLIGGLIPTSCNVAATPLAFGTYDPFLGSDTTSVSTVTVRCRGLAGLVAAYEIRLSPGGGGDIFDRSLSATGSPEDLSYQVYVDPARTIVWGDDSGGATFSGAMLLSVVFGAQTRIAYGKLPTGQSVPSGAYGDQPVMTVIF